MRPPMQYVEIEVPSAKNKRIMARVVLELSAVAYVYAFIDHGFKDPDDESKIGALHVMIHMQGGGAFDIIGNRARRFLERFEAHAKAEKWDLSSDSPGGK